MTAPITPDERSIMRALADRMETYYGEADAASGIRRLLDALDTAEAKVARLRDEAARPAPVWDEDTVHEAVARAVFGAFQRDVDRGVFPHTAVAVLSRTAAHEVLAVVREHLPVRPDREDVARALWRQTVRDNAMHDESVVPWDEIPTETREWWCVYADAVLGLWPGESRATVQAEALRDAAAAAVAQDNNQGDWWDDDRQTYGTPVDWLRARADRLEKGETR